MTVANPDTGHEGTTGRLRLCAIHQPNFFPWMGYFDKIRRADVFVFMDDVDYPRSGSGMGTWCNRVKINVQNQARWVGIPVARYSGRRKIKDIRIAEDLQWRKRMKRTLQMNYAKASNYESAMEVVCELIDYDSRNLAEFNINAITKLCTVLGIGSEFHRQTELFTSENSTKLLIEISQSVEANAYLSGGGADGYQDDELFDKTDIQLEYQNFPPEPYCPEADFLPGLSVIDYLMKSPSWI